MEQVTIGTTERGETEAPLIDEKDLMGLFHERDLSQEEVDLATREVKESVLEALGYNPLCASYFYPRPNQVEECNNPNTGDGLLRRHIVNINKIIWSLHRNNGVVEPPRKFKK